MDLWQSVGPIASVDWCEPNYVHSSLVAEWWNTLSSVPIALAGLSGVIQSLRAQRQARFTVAFLGVFVVGLGSAAFHGTLLRWAQATDELPMIFSGLCFVYIVHFRRSGDAHAASQRRWQLVLGSYALGFSVAYFAMPTYFVFFIATYAALVAYVVLRSGFISFRHEPEARRKQLYVLAVASYVGGVLLLWVPEHLVLACDHPLQAMQLHAIFHLTSATGSYAWIVWAIWDRQLALARPV